MSIGPSVYETLGWPCPHCGHDHGKPDVMAYEASNALLVAQAEKLAEALGALVRLKDGPRDDAYRASKDAAWEAGRDALREYRAVIA